MPGTKRALFVDWGGTLALTKDNRTVVDAAGHPVLMPNVAATLARERPRMFLELAGLHDVDLSTSTHRWRLGA